MAYIDIVGKVVKILPKKSIKGNKGSYASQIIWIEESPADSNDKGPFDTYAIEFYGDRVNSLSDIKIGRIYTIPCDIRGKIKEKKDTGEEYIRQYLMGTDIY